MDNLQRRVRALNDNGDPMFVLSNLHKTVSTQHAVMDAVVPEYLRTAGGPLFTKASLEAGKLKQVDVEGRNLLCALIELVKTYEEHVDFESDPVIDATL